MVYPPDVRDFNKVIPPPCPFLTTRGRLFLLKKSNRKGGRMARRRIHMNEYLEMIYQWHKGRTEREICDSLGIDRKTIRRYMKRLRAVRVTREQPLPEQDQLVQLVSLIQHS